MGRPVEGRNKEVIGLCKLHKVSYTLNLYVAETITFLFNDKKWEKAREKRDSFDREIKKCLNNFNKEDDYMIRPSEKARKRRVATVEENLKSIW